MTLIKTLEPILTASVSLLVNHKQYETKTSTSKIQFEKYESRKTIEEIEDSVNRNYPPRLNYFWESVLVN